ncbi:MAG: response regulator [Proteobacteria bacterium]|nr:response regulator [Pseudomonadota bacterium]
MKILIVDDNPVNIDLLVNALKDGYEICTALNGYDAISLVKEESPDLILLDVMMPDLDGFEVCRLIRAEGAYADIPIIFVTAIDSLEGEVRGLELGAVDYITKPVNLKLAKLRVRNQLELRRQRNIVKEQNAVLTRQKEELEATLGRLKRLEGMLSVCMSCKKIRTESNAWQQFEQYLGEHSDAVFSHGLCPECFAEQKARLG